MTDKRQLLSRMAAAGYTQYALAREIGISKNTLCAKINGKSRFTTEEVFAICRVLHIDAAKDIGKIFYFGHP